MKYLHKFDNEKEFNGAYAEKNSIEIPIFTINGGTIYSVNTSNNEITIVSGETHEYDGIYSFDSIASFDNGACKYSDGTHILYADYNTMTEYNVAQSSEIDSSNIYYSTLIISYPITSTVYVINFQNITKEKKIFSIIFGNKWFY